MKISAWVFCGGLLTAIAPACAQQQQPAKADEKEAEPNSLGASEKRGSWNSENIKLVCGIRWTDQPRSYSDCVKHHQVRIGRPMTPGDMQDLQAAQVQNRPMPQPKKNPANPAPAPYAPQR